ncbi:MAG: fused MFS/spermidine synthase [Candidatus Micrarchaeia archaeon]|jgi:spermidine synthase
MKKPNNAQGHRRLLEALAFVSGAAVLVLEIAGARMLAPAFGSSIFVWTAQICTVLVALALGYYYGGRHADAKDRMAQASKMFLFACATLAVSLFLSGIVLSASAMLGAKIGPFVFSAFLFFAPCFFAGAITPVLLREYVQGMESVGNDAGRIYAISTAGSLAGALLSAYVIVPFVGAKAGMFITAAAFFALALLSRWRMDIDRVAVFFLLFASLFSFAHSTSLNVPDDLSVAKEYDSEYFHIRIAENGTHKLLLLDADAHSMITKGREGLVFEYTKKMAHATDAYMAVGGKRVAVLGLGAGTLPRHFAAKGADVTVYEIDPAVLATARQDFEFPEMENLQVHIGDARALLVEDAKQYDLLVIDAFASRASIPVHLATREAFGIYRDSVKEDGLLVMNIISPAEGRKADVFRSISETAREEFPHQVAILTNDNREALQNIILVASAAPLGEGYLERLEGEMVMGSWGAGTGYTDERSSIDYAMMQVLE